MCSFAAASLAAILMTSGSVQAEATNVRGCLNQSNPPLVVHRVLPGQHAADASAARAIVAVKLARTGHILAVALERPSGSAAFDRAALAAATATTFAPAAKGCVAVDTLFRYVVARDDSHQLTADVLPQK
jgi:TonB family protein